MSALIIVMMLAAAPDCRLQAEQMTAEAARVRDAWWEAGKSQAIAFGAPDPATSKDYAWEFKTYQQQRAAELARKSWADFLVYATPVETANVVLDATKKAREAKLPLSSSEEQFLLLWDTESLLQAFGFAKFFAERSDKDVAPIRAAFAKHSSVQFSLFECALSVFPKSKLSGDAKARAKQLAAVDAKHFATLDAAWRAQIPLYVNLVTRVRKEPDAFPLAKAARGGQ